MTTLPASLRRAQILEQIQARGGATVAELARDHAVSTMTAHRDLEQLAREGLVERVRGGARALAAGGPQPHPTAWDHRVGVAWAAKRGDRRGGGDDDRRRLDGLPRRVVERARAGAAAHGGPALRADAGHELADDRRRGPRGAAARRRLPRRARPAHAHGHRALDARVPARPAPRHRVRVRRRHHPGGGADDLARRARRRLQRRARGVRAHGRAARRDEVRPRLARLDRRGARARPDRDRCGPGRGGRRGLRSERRAAAGWRRSSS